MSGVRFTTPVVCALYGVARAKGWEIIPPVTKDAGHYLEYMVATSHGNSHYTPLISCSDNDEVMSIVADIRSIIDKWVPPETSEDLDYAIHESMNNVFDHSESPEGFFIHCQKYPEKHFVELAIIDLGVGVAESLQQNLTYSDMSPMEAFEKALTIRITSKPDQNAGEGLSSTLEWVKYNQDAGARGILLSNNHIWLTGKTTQGITDRGKICWPGTLLWLRIPFSPQNNIVDVWDILGIGSDVDIDSI